MGHILREEEVFIGEEVLEDLGALEASVAPHLEALEASAEVTLEEVVLVENSKKINNYLFISKNKYIFAKLFHSPYIYIRI